MPFKSQAQRRKFYAMANKGEIADATVKHWEDATGDKKLPERVTKKASYLKGTEAAFEKLGISLRKIRSVAEQTGEGIRNKVHYPPAVQPSGWGKPPSFRKRMSDAENHIANRSFKHTKRGLELEDIPQSEKHHALAEGLWKGFKGLDSD